MSNPLELAVFSAQGTAVYPLAPGQELVVGRGDDADIRIDDVAISRRHAIFRGGPPIEIEDLGSANGTFVSARGGAPRGGVTADQRRVAATRTELGVGDTVFFGAAVVVVRKGREGGAETKGPARDLTKTDGLRDYDAVVQSPVLVRLYEEAARAAKMALPVLILGETGAGKEVLAQFIHAQSPRAKRPMVALNCAALTESLAESELFGYERGAFTGAAATRAGLFEAASGGTIFLDEIGELPLATQAKLLRTLESKEVQRVGSTTPIKVDVRVISATNRDLVKASAEGAFRQDLYFRVNGISLTIPPLRERVTEIGELARRFLAAASREMGLEQPPSISPEAMAALEAYSWPGNVREVRYVMERTLVTAAEEPIQPRHLPPQVTAVLAKGAAVPREELATRERVIEALAECDGNQTRAAEKLGVSRRTLINRMIEFGLPRPRKGDQKS